MITPEKPRPAATQADPDWWRGAIIYQIYPRSFQDSNNDGIGDLTGIKNRLAYISELGADAIWISPFFTSPMRDFGYDVSDYKDIDPMFGDLNAFDAMVEEAHRLNVRVMIDLVLSHTSDQHPWFKESRSSRKNDRHDWYVWSDAKPDGTAPNNWLSIFGGPAWTWDTTRLQYYMHNFLTSQPDLNFHNVDVQAALLDVARFWLNRGVDGFRLDTINFYFCDQALQDNPALPASERNSEIAPAVNPYNYQSHLYDKNQPENLVFLQSLRKVMDEYSGIAAVGEIGDAQKSMELLSAYTKTGRGVHMCYTFDFLSHAQPTADRVHKILSEFIRLGDSSWICWAFSNHDVVRHATRWSTQNEYSEQHLKLLASLLLSLRGSVCLYQGEELGLPEADVPFELLQDPYGVKFWPEFKGRDGCRTPMVWDTDEPNGGFSHSTPWLPVAKAHLARSVNAQLVNTDSLLQHYRQFIQFRRNHVPLVKGGLEDLHVQGQSLCLTRRHNNQAIFCAFNLAETNTTVTLPPECHIELLEGHGFNCQVQEPRIDLSAYQAVYARIA